MSGDMWHPGKRQKEGMEKPGLIWRDNDSDGGTSLCKGPEASIGLGCCWDSKYTIRM